MSRTPPHDPVGSEAPAPTDGAESLAGTQSIRRAMAVLRLVACGQEQGVRVSDIAAMSGLSRPTVHRLLKVLVQETAVEQDPATRRYAIGPELALLGLARGGRIAIRAVAEDYLRALAAEVGDVVFISVRHGADSVCIGRYLGHQGIQVLSIDVGVRRPLGASVSGVVLLSGLPAAEAERVTRRNAARLSHAGVDAGTVLQHVAQARAQHHRYALDGVMKGTSAVAVPIRDPSGDIVAAISVAAMANRLDRKRLPRVLGLMQTSAAQIAARLVEVESARRR